MLSKDLRVPHQTLYRAMAFAQAFDALPTHTHLTWSHYRTLLALPNQEQRDWYASFASEGRLPVARLVQAIADRRHASAKRNRNRSSKAPALKRPLEPRYVYGATLDRVVDGDTLIVTFDLGFGVLKKERIRLAGVDTPPGATAQGKRATEFVKRALSDRPQLCLQTRRTDKYGRYIAHVMYSKKEMSFASLAKNGIHLNQQLLDEGLAVPA